MHKKIQNSFYKRIFFNPMKKLVVILLTIIQVSILYSKNIEPEKEDNPKDTLKVYYLDEVVISSSVKETNQLKNLPTVLQNRKAAQKP